MILSKNAGSLPEDFAHAIRTTAIATAARITSAYSAVVCPASCRRNDYNRTYSQTSNIHLLPQ